MNVRFQASLVTTAQVDVKLEPKNTHKEVLSSLFVPKHVTLTSCALLLTVKLGPLFNVSPN